MRGPGWGTGAVGGTGQGSEGRGACSFREPQMPRTTQDLGADVPLKSQLAGQNVLMPSLSVRLPPGGEPSTWVLFNTMDLGWRTLEGASNETHPLIPRTSTLHVVQGAKERERTRDPGFNPLSKVPAACAMKRCCPCSRKPRCD